MHELIDWLVTAIGAMGCPGIFLLMAIEKWDLWGFRFARLQV